ncbi:MAG: polysaccharide deacetylase family protein [Anaerovoracaceae bacterium]
MNNRGSKPSVEDIARKKQTLKVKNSRKRRRVFLLLLVFSASLLLCIISLTSIINIKSTLDLGSEIFPSEIKLKANSVIEDSLYFYAFINTHTAKINPLDEDYNKKKNASIYKKKKDKEKIIYLTFDDGPTSKNTPGILKVLEKYNVQATFFVIGYMAKRNPEQITKTADAGHLIANHGYSHDYAYIYKNKKNQLADAKKGYRTIRQILGNDYYYKIYRFPGGGQPASYKKYKNNLESNFYYYFDWNCESGDANGVTSVKGQLNQLKSGTKGNKNVIVLMHDSYAAKNTPKTLDMYLSYCKDKGYEFRTLADYCYSEN